MRYNKGVVSNVLKTGSIDSTNWTMNRLQNRSSLNVKTILFNQWLNRSNQLNRSNLFIIIFIFNNILIIYL